MIGWWGILALTCLDAVLWAIVYEGRHRSAAARRLWRYLSRRGSRTRPGGGAAGAPGRRPQTWLVRSVTAWSRPLRSEVWRRREADRLLRAGLNWDPALFDVVKVAGGLGGISIAATGGALGVLPGGTLRWAAVMGGLGYLMPVVWVRRRGRERAREFGRALPDALDVMAICLRGGLGLQAAVAEYAATASGVAGEAFRQYLADLALGQPPEAGFADLARRYPSGDITVVSAGLVQGIRLGSPLADVLEEQASHFRTLALRRAEEAARALTTRLVLPLVAFIFPQVFVIGLGPVALRFLGPGGLFR